MNGLRTTDLVPEWIEVGSTLARSSEWYHRRFVVILATQLWESNSDVAEDAEIEQVAPRPRRDVNLLLSYWLSDRSRRTGLPPTREQNDLVDGVKRSVRRAEVLYREIAYCSDPLKTLYRRMDRKRPFLSEFEVRSALADLFTPTVAALANEIDRAFQQLNRPNALLVVFGILLSCVETPSDLVAYIAGRQVAAGRALTLLGMTRTLRARGGVRAFRGWDLSKGTREARALYVVDVLTEFQRAGFDHELVDQLLKRFDLQSLLDRDEWSDLNLEIAPFIADLKSRPLALRIDSSLGEAERPGFDGSHLSLAGERVAIPSILRKFTDELVKRQPALVSYADLIAAEELPGGDEKSNRELMQSRKCALKRLLMGEPINGRVQIKCESREGYRLVVQS